MLGENGNVNEDGLPVRGFQSRIRSAEVLLNAAVKRVRHPPFVSFYFAKNRTLRNSTVQISLGVYKLIKLVFYQYRWCGSSV